MDRDRYGSFDMDRAGAGEISSVSPEIAEAADGRPIELVAARLISSRHRVAHVLGSTRLVAWRWVQAARSYVDCPAAEVDALEWRRLGA